MNYIYIFLLLLVIFSAYAESPQYAQPPLIEATIYPNSSFAQMGILAPVLPHNEVYKTTPPHNAVYKTPPHNEVYKTPPHNEVYTPPLNEVYTPPLNEVYNLLLNEVYKTPPLNEVYKTTLPHNEVYEIIMLQNGWKELFCLRMRLSGIKLFCLSLRCLELM
jgi:hypothetical protein